MVLEAFSTVSPRCKGLSRQRDHGRASPEDVHAGGVPVAERSVQAHVYQLAPAHVLLLRRHIAEGIVG